MSCLHLLLSHAFLYVHGVIHCFSMCLSLVCASSFIVIGLGVREASCLPGPSPICQSVSGSPGVGQAGGELRLRSCLSSTRRRRAVRHYLLIVGIAPAVGGVPSHDGEHMVTQWPGRQMGNQLLPEAPRRCPPHHGGRLAATRRPEHWQALDSARLISRLRLVGNDQTTVTSVL